MAIGTAFGSRLKNEKYQFAGITGTSQVKTYYCRRKRKRNKKQR